MNEQKLDALQRAIQFLDLCRADSNAGPTGALRDAVQWVESAARDLLADDAITHYYAENRGQGSRQECSDDHRQDRSPAPSRPQSP